MHRHPQLAYSALCLVPPLRVLEEIHLTLLRTQADHQEIRNLEVHMEVAKLQHQITIHKETWVKRRETIPFTKMKQQNPAISVHLSIMVAKKFILQIRKPVALTTPSKKMELMRIVVLRGETGGKDLSTTKSLYIYIYEELGNGKAVNNPKVWPEFAVVHELMLLCSVCLSKGLFFC